MSKRPPNILFVMSDDHAAHAIGCYGSRVNRTPHLDRLAASGLRGDRVFCTNSICAPSRACILTGTYNHVNGVRTLSDRFDGRQDTVARRLQAAGYQTALIGKWHLGHGGEADPTGFDHWCVLPGQGEYHDPFFLTPAGRHQVPGYCTEIITAQSLDWLRRRDPDRPFFLMCHHKAPHRPWNPAPRYRDLFAGEDVPVPETFGDDHATMGRAARAARMTMWDLNPQDLKEPVPPGLTRDQEHHWRYQRYIKDYLRCVQSVDDSVGELLDALDAAGLRDDTVVIYTSDQGFFLGDHDWFDKRFMYEESLRMPFLVSYPREIPTGTVSADVVLNVDFPATFLDWAGLPVPEAWHGRSARACLRGSPPPDWRRDFYYRYWMHKDGAHGVWAHYGLRTHDFKIICFYADVLDCPDPWAPRLGFDQAPEPPEWELYDLRKDPRETLNVYQDPDYADIAHRLRARLFAAMAEVGDTPHDHPDCRPA